MSQNILPKKEYENIISGYKKRKLILLCWVLFFSFIASVVIFLPNLFLVRSKISSLLNKDSETAEAIKEQEVILAKPAQINKAVSAALNFQSKPSIASRISTVFSSAQSDVTVNSVTVSQKVSNNQQPTMLVSGVAKNRNSLLNFEANLKKLNFVKSTSIPVSNFTKDENLPFTVTLFVNNPK